MADAIDISGRPFDAQLNALKQARETLASHADPARQTGAEANVQRAQDELVEACRRLRRMDPESRAKAMPAYRRLQAECILRQVEADDLRRHRRPWHVPLPPSLRRALIHSVEGGVQ